MFSGAALLADLDDFIAPSQSCVNPLFTEPAPPARAGATGARGGGARLELASDFLLPAAPSAAAATAPPPPPPAARPDLIRSSAPSGGAGSGGPA